MAMFPRSRRALTTCAAAVLVLSLTAGCGGSEVQESATGVTSGAVDASIPGTELTEPIAAGDVPAAATDPAAATAGTKAPSAGGPAGTKADPKVKPAGGTAGVDPARVVASGSPVEKLVASAPIFGGNGACKPATLSPVNIGNVSTLSGVLGELFSPVRSALETFVASQNACGGLNGHRINLYIDDDQGDPSTASSKVQEMIQSKKVLAFIGNIELLTIDAVVPIIKKYGIPILGSDLTNNTWFTNPLLFPQGSGGQSISYGFIDAAVNYFKKKNIGNIWCIEVPRACEQIDRAFKELAPQLGATVKRTIQVSITAPSYVQQCLEMKNSGVEALGLTFDAASQHRLARSCEQVGYFPKIMVYPLGVGNEKQWLQGNKWLGDAYVPMNHFPWFASDTPALRYWQSSIKKFNPGFTSGGTAAMGWASGALLVAAAANLSAENPTTQQLLEGLWTFKGQQWTTLGGLTPPLTYVKDGSPRIPYCLFSAISNADNTGWASSSSKPVCTKVLAPSDPQTVR